MQEMLNHRGDGIEGKTCVVSGSGNVATYCAEKINALGGKVVTLSDSGGFIHDPDGINDDKLAWVLELKNKRRGRISEYADHFGVDYHEGKTPWGVNCDLAFPCATQNELGEDDAKALVANGCMAVSEGANMPTTVEGIKVLQDAKVLYGPGKAANAGGVAVSGLEMTQNSMRMAWTAEETEEKLQSIMRNIHSQCVRNGLEGDYVNYVKGANIAGFIKVADAMLAYGVI
jgi:glutamate dehydrogenase (NADP+)